MDNNFVFSLPFENKIQPACKYVSLSIGAVRRAQPIHGLAAVTHPQAVGNSRRHLEVGITHADRRLKAGKERIQPAVPGHIDLDAGHRGTAAVANLL